MHAHDILMYGHRTVLHAVADLPEADWLTSGVCGWWSVKDILAHLASFEHVLEELLDHLVDPAAPIPTLEQFQLTRGDPFNALQVELRSPFSVQQVLDEYTHVHEQTLERLEGVSGETLRRVGTLPWYGQQYSLDDFIVYAFYGHKREHSAQIAVFRDHLPPAP
ncbi:MAG: maleylpyruvate isomerase N-terminal domain-containing protein [Anaerolineaceae bacterium]|jgi:uncharacterized damage-inducible protein DinB|nr:maleylpyruvate isomerase N-terminal domain-containing protein [Anaerolineaceae bacterium]